MDKAYPLSSPMVVRSLDKKRDGFWLWGNDEELLSSEVPYLSAIGALMYLASYTRPDIAFSINLLAIYSFVPTQSHWNNVKHIFQYLQDTMDIGLYYINMSQPDLVSYIDVGYLSDPHNSWSQTSYIFTCEAIHEISRECV